MTTIHLECPDSDPPDRSIAAHVLLRQEPDEDEERKKTKATAKKKKMTMMTTRTAIRN